MEFTEQGLILRVGRFKEADLWVRFLTPRRGVISVFAFGGSRSRRRFCGCLDLFNMVTATIKGTRGGTYLSLQEATLLRGTQRLRRDWKRCGMATNCLRFIEALGAGQENAPEAFSLGLDMLELLEQEEYVPPLFPVLFRARYAFAQGYAPRLECCAGCGKPAYGSADMRFLVREGVLYCAECSAPAGAFVSVSLETLDALRFVQEHSPLLWSTLELSSLAQRECSRAVDGFIQYHIGLTWENGRFRRL